MTIYFVALEQDARNFYARALTEFDLMAVPNLREVDAEAEARGAGPRRVKRARRASSYESFGGSIPRKRKQLFQAMSAWSCGGRPSARRRTEPCRRGRRTLR